MCAIHSSLHAQSQAVQSLFQAVPTSNTCLTCLYTTTYTEAIIADWSYKGSAAVIQQCAQKSLCMHNGLSSAVWLFRRRLSTAHALAAHVTTCKVTVHAVTRCFTTVLNVFLELQGWQASMPWDTNPLYALMHESIYCHPAASNWAAHRIRQVQLFVIHASQLHCGKPECIRYSNISTLCLSYSARCIYAVSLM